MRDPERIGPYQIVRKLGQGGMGVVYEARHPMVPRRLALKLVLERNASEKARARFFREAEALARVKHPAVVQVHQLGRAPEGPYLVQELVEGEPLSKLTRAGPLDPARAARIAATLARAVQAVHDIDVVHRDIKPQNVMIRPDGAPVLLDFGLARDQNAESLTKTGELLGTPAYMPPEQTSGEAERRSDVYAVGAVLYEMLTGAPPFTADSAIQIIHAILSRDPVWPRVSRPEVSEGLDAIVRVAMAKKVVARYPSAAALAEDLERELAGEPPIALELASKLPATATGRRPATLVVALAAVGVVIGGATAALLPGRAPAPATATAPNTTAPTTEAAPRRDPLWSFQGAKPLRYRLHLGNTVDYDVEEKDPAYVFGATLVVKPGDGGSLACRVSAISVEARNIEGMDARYDSDNPQPSVLEAMGAGKDLPFTCDLDRVTGGVTRMSGFAAIREAIFSRADELDTRTAIEKFVNKALTDEFIGASMHALTCVVDGSRSVPWRETTASGAALLTRTFQVASGTGPRALPGFLEGIESDVTFDGRARYADGHLEEATVTQTHRRVPDRLQIITWSMTLLTH
jgi:tRNA A-37 threonylcarbamoyl transferase component Bud32